VFLTLAYSLYLYIICKIKKNPLLAVLRIWTIFVRIQLSNHLYTDPVFVPIFPTGSFNAKMTFSIKILFLIKIIVYNLISTFEKNNVVKLEYFAPYCFHDNSVAVPNTKEYKFCSGSECEK
jgi:hypothetical protein